MQNNTRRVAQQLTQGINQKAHMYHKGSLWGPWRAWAHSMSVYTHFNGQWKPLVWPPEALQCQQAGGLECGGIKQVLKGASFYFLIWTQSSMYFIKRTRAPIINSIVRNCGSTPTLLENNSFYPCDISIVLVGKLSHLHNYQSYTQGIVWGRQDTADRRQYKAEIEHGCHLYCMI